ncbi:hypothetical protein N8I77_007199 [Diaporthe amygdali]|uniref:Uncharacterized protein n=1 Tax=Phomopsis amygdali TaxID=1214568 RepID=A0AAD9W3V2_PHOAM|nr:hypothetical protein N8I77_007199 [Diaporthe amygdali]
MDRVALESHSNALSAAIKSLAGTEPSPGQFVSNAPQEAKAQILASVESIKRLVVGPTEFLQELARQVEMLACLQWLAEFGILTCIPSDVSIQVPMKDIADLTSVPTAQLGRVVRLLGTAGFLQEREAGCVAHTRLSACFCTDQALLDAAIFLARWVAPAALQMPAATRRFGASEEPTECAYSLARNSNRSFHSALQEGPKLQRQWFAYLSLAGGLHHEDEAVADVLSGLQWKNLGPACIVEAGATSTPMAAVLADKFPNLRLIVQIDNANSSPLIRAPAWSHGRPSSSSRGGDITVTYRAAGTAQPMTAATVYIIHPPSLRPASARDTAGADFRAELRVHIDLVRSGSALILVPTARLLPEPGSIADPQVEGVARVRDLSMYQLGNENEMELSELSSTIEKVGDELGRLVITRHLRSHSNLTMALVVKYQAY